MLTPQQVTVLMADVSANTALIGGVEIRSLPHNSDSAFAIAGFYNQLSSPAYWAWDRRVTRAKIYHQTSGAGTIWDWTTYKNQSQGEQGAWIQMFMGDEADFGLQNLRSGVLAVFSGSGAQLTQRAHVYAAGQRRVTRVERLFVAAVNPVVANTGNDGVALNRGQTTNPDLLVVDGFITEQDVQWGN